MTTPADDHVPDGDATDGDASDGDALARLRAELEELRRENAELRRRLERAGGRPVAPDEPSEADGPDAASAPAATPVVTSHETSVDLSGLMAVVSEHLYSTPLVALRELVQNAHDSIVRRRRAEPDTATGVIRVDVVDGRLVVADDGDGMTDDEIHECLATVGRGATGALRRETGDPDLIGQFGLGFLSAFVLGDEVEVRTMSRREPGVLRRYRSADGLTYELDVVPTDDNRSTPGTTVAVHLSGTGADLTDVTRLADVLGRYCALLRIPVEVAGERVNVTPPWRVGYDDPSVANAAALAFAARFEHGVEPICVLPVTGTTLDADGTDVRGQLWVQDGRSWATSDSRNLAVFVRGMLLDDDARDLLPTWAGFVGGVIESGSLVPTASREDLQRTAAYDATARLLSRRLLDGLAHVARHDPATWRRVVRRHNEALIGAAVADDEVFDLVADVVEIPTSEGDLRPADLVARSGGRIHLSLSVGGGFEEMVCRCLRVPVARGHRYGVAPFLRRWCNLRGVPLTEVGTADGDRDLFFAAEVSPETSAWLARGLAAPDEQLVTSRFEPAALPLVAVPDREAELKARIEDDEADRRISVAALRLARAHTAATPARPPVRLHVNLRSPHVQQLVAAFEADPTRAGLDRALGVLRATKVLLASHDGGGADDHLVAALDRLGAAACRELDHPGGG